jgi:predicted lipoprotein with Yx(FWY)xxD motif
MKRVRILLAGVLVAALSCVAVASAQPRAHTAQTNTIELRETNLGQIVVNSSGFTLFMFTKDRMKKEACQSISGCTSVWPPLLVTGTPMAGPGLNAKKLSTITLENGTKQATYAGHPLYMYSFNKGPGETGYVGAKEFGGSWFALNAMGKKVK